MTTRQMPRERIPMKSYLKTALIVVVTLAVVNRVPQIKAIVG